MYKGEGGAPPYEGATRVFLPRSGPPVLLLALSHTVNGVSLPPASLLASGRRPITALTTADQEFVYNLCLVLVRKLDARTRLEPRIALFKLNRSQTRYAHDLVRDELVSHELVRQY